MKRETLKALLDARDSGRSVVLATHLTSGTSQIVDLAEAEGALGDAARNAARLDRSAPAEIGGENWFLTVFNTPLRLLVVGAVHIAQPLARMAALAGYAVTVIDPRTAFASEERFPGVTLITAWPDDALRSLTLDPRTAVVTLTHDPKLDDPALAEALRSHAFYVGALGSKKTHAARLARLKAQGFDDKATSRIKGPVGLDIGAISPAEIAVSILAEITATLRGPKRA